MADRTRKQTASVFSHVTVMAALLVTSLVWEVRSENDHAPYRPGNSFDFTEVDTDGSGCVEGPEEMQKFRLYVGRILGETLKLGDVERALRAGRITHSADMNGDGKICECDLLSILLTESTGPGMHRHAFRVYEDGAIFDDVDADGDGYLSDVKEKEGLTQKLALCVSEVKARTVVDAISKLEKDDGKLARTEYLLFLKSPHHIGTDPHLLPASLQPRPQPVRMGLQPVPQPVPQPAAQSGFPRSQPQQRPQQVVPEKPFDAALGSPPVEQAPRPVEETSGPQDQPSRPAERSLRHPKQLPFQPPQPFRPLPAANLGRPFQPIVQPGQPFRLMNPSGQPAQPTNQPAQPVQPAIQQRLMNHEDQPGFQALHPGLQPHGDVRQVLQHPNQLTLLENAAASVADDEPVQPEGPQPTEGKTELARNQPDQRQGAYQPEDDSNESDLRQTAATMGAKNQPDQPALQPDQPGPQPHPQPQPHPK